MKLQSRVAAALAASVVLTFQLGCASTEESDISPDWVSPMSAQEYSAVHVLHDGECVFLGSDRNVFVVDGRTGTVINSLEESWTSAVPRQASGRIGGLGFSAGDFMATTYDMVPVPEHNLVFLFDHQADKEIVMALDSQTGELLWRSDEYEFSLAKYTVGVSRAADAIGGRLASLLGGSHESEDEGERRFRQVRFLEKVFMPVPGSDLLAFKTFEGLYFIHPRTGEVEVHIPDFQGAGLADIQELENGDLLVLSGAQSIVMSMGAGFEYHLARISPLGNVRWKQSHSG